MISSLFCKKCGAETSSGGDLHCRKILQTETRQLLLDGKIKDAESSVSQAKFDEAWKRIMLQRLYIEPEIQQVIWRVQNEIRTRAELTNLFAGYLFSEAEQFYKQHRDIVGDGEYNSLLNNAKNRWQKQLVLSQAQKQFAELANKYKVDINKVVDKDGPTLLAKILTKLEEQKDLDESELKWLEENRVFELLANYYYQASKNFPGNGEWSLAKASKFYIKTGMAQKAIEITDGFSEILSIDHSADSAVYTSRGAAFRRLNTFDKAKECANKAISLSPRSFHPYNLLGGIAYDEGDIESGTGYFEKAIEMDSSPRVQEAEIRTAQPEARKAIVDYLLKKDPQKYSWVKQFQSE
ncbi:MAG: hypothetical protein EXS69_02605 [Candidatus Zambryskibacteria bacterium]|nr:hypothetical protein [Candidatus Zambryskibacteria bacterium]